MGRYLTPSKLGLLALLVVYTESVVPANASIPVLAFLVSQVIPGFGEAGDETSADRNVPIETSVNAIEMVTKSLSSGIPGRSVWDLFLNKIWKIDSLDTLHAFFEGLASLILGTQRLSEHENVLSDQQGEIRLSKNSPLGIFTRRAHLEFTRLQFDDSITLWHGLKAFRDPTFQQWRKRNPHARVPLFGDAGTAVVGTGEVLGDLRDVTAWEHPMKHQHTVSTDEIERLLDFQVQQIQKIGTRLPRQAISRLQNMLSHSASHPNLVFYVQFLDAWKTRDYLTSFDRLHRYFDYTMHQRDRNFYHYALLNLAALHADFGAYEEAMSAIRETISTAREFNDLCCLNYSLSWLYHFGKAFPGQIEHFQFNGISRNDREALNFMKAKSKEAQTWSTFSTSLLAEARLCLANLEGDNPPQIFALLLKAAHVDLTKKLAATNGNHAALLSNLYARLGISRQSMLVEELFMSCYGPYSPAEDRVQGRSRLANLIDQRGRYSEAWDVIQDIEPEALRTPKYERSWIVQVALMRIKRLIHSDRLDDAGLALNGLKSMGDHSPEISQVTQLMEVELLVRRQEYAKALNILESSASSLDLNSPDIFQELRIMNTKARIYERAGTPQKSLSVVLRAASLAFAAKILPMLWESIRALCGVLNSFGEFRASIKLLESIMPRVLEFEDNHLVACSFATLADAHVGDAGGFRGQPLQVKERLYKASENLDEAFSSFSRCQDVRGQCEMLAKKATIMQYNGDTVLANDCAARCLSIQKAAREDES